MILNLIILFYSNTSDHYGSNLTTYKWTAIAIVYGAIVENEWNCQNAIAKTVSYLFELLVVRLIHN